MASPAAVGCKLHAHRAIVHVFANIVEMQLLLKQRLKLCTAGERSEEAENEPECGGVSEARKREIEKHIFDNPILVFWWAHPLPGTPCLNAGREVLVAIRAVLSFRPPRYTA